MRADWRTVSRFLALLTGEVYRVPHVGECSPPRRSPHMSHLSAVTDTARDRIVWISNSSQLLKTSCHGHDSWIRGLLPLL